MSHRCQCVCVCVVPIAQGVFRYNECPQQCVLLLYLGQLRTASRAAITSVSLQLNRLKLVAFFAAKKIELQKVVQREKHDFLFSGCLLAASLFTFLVLPF